MSENTPVDETVARDAASGAHLIRQTVLLAMEGMCPCYFGGPYTLVDVKGKPDTPGAVFLVYQSNPGGSFWMVDIGTPTEIDERLFSPAKEAWLKEKQDKLFVLVLMMKDVNDRDRAIFNDMLKKTFI